MVHSDSILDFIFLLLYLSSMGSPSGMNQTNDKMVVVCYVQGEGFRRRGNAKFDITGAETKVCSDFVFGYVNISISSRSFQNIYPQDDIAQRKLVDIKGTFAKVRVLLALGGDEVGSRPFEKIAESNTRLLVFSNNVANALRKQKFDGMEVAWTSQEAKHKDTVQKICRFLRGAFDREARKTKKTKLLLTLAVLAQDTSGEKLYAPAQIEHYVDRITVLAFNLDRNSHSTRLRHHSPLRVHAERWETLSQSQAMAWWVDKCVSRKKLILGLATFGRSTKIIGQFSGKGKGGLWPGKEVIQKSFGDQGPFTQTSGALAYYELCTIVRSGNWKEGFAPIWNSPYAYGKRNTHTEWVSFENPRSVRIKTDFVIDERYGGLMIMSLDMDDSKGTFCNEGSYPLTRAASKILLVEDMTFKLLPSREDPHKSRKSISYWLYVVTWLLFLFVGILIGIFANRMTDRGFNHLHS